MQDRAIKTLQAQFPNIHGIKDANEWSAGYKPGHAIHLGDAAEGGEIEGWPACDYYAEDPLEQQYIMGVHKDLRQALEELGYYPECYDPGTYIAFKEATCQTEQN